MMSALPPLMESCIVNLLRRRGEMSLSQLIVAAGVNRRGPESAHAFHRVLLMQSTFCVHNGELFVRLDPRRSGAVWDRMEVAAALLELGRAPCPTQKASSR